MGSEATDRISLVVFGPGGATVEREFTVSFYPTESDGPHGLAMSPDGALLYVTTGHGRPFGNLWKIDPETGRSLGRVELGLFPASLAVSPEGSFAFVANFNLHGDMVPSSISVVSTERMIEVSRLETCTMPHGSRLSSDGRRQYSTCMMDDMLVEVDAWGLGVARHFRLAPGAEAGHAGPPGGADAAGHGAPAHGAAGHGAPGHAHHADMPKAVCSPTWAQPAADDRSVFVACNRSGELVEIDLESWSLVRRIPAAPGIYNVEVTSDGRRLVATNKQDDSVSIFDLASGTEEVRLRTHRRVVHGVVISPDDRYAFITVEGVGSEPGTLEVLDLSAGEFVARVDLPPMSAGVAFWR
ncbi:MAG: YncE family protein [Gemmatimonadales bacterium]|nr:MAG: YncE family protein [Gemmatimonadales bacterium]